MFSAEPVASLAFAGVEPADPAPRVFTSQLQPFRIRSAKARTSSGSTMVKLLKYGLRYQDSVVQNGQHLLRVNLHK